MTEQQQRPGIDPTRIAVIVLAGVVVVAVTILAAFEHWGESAVTRVYVGALVAATLAAGVRLPQSGSAGSAAALALAQAGAVFGASEAGAALLTLGG